MKAAIIYNQKAGKPEYSPEKLCELLESEISSDLFNTNGNKINEIIEKIRWKNYDIIIAAGGDGTISTVAKQAVKLKMRLGIIPSGTLNHFAKDLNIPVNPEIAVDIIKKGKTGLIDTAEVNGHLFLNNSSIGIYPDVIRKKKDEMEPGGNKWIALIKAGLTVFRSIPIMEIKIQSDETVAKFKTSILFVGNNDYKMDLFNLGRRDKLDEGILCLYYLNYRGRISYTKLLFKTLLGKLKEEENFTNLHSRNVTIYSKKKALEVSLDGEVTRLNTPLNYKINPGSLLVFVP